MSNEHLARDGKVVPLDLPPQPPEPERPARRNRLHSLGISGMALFALTGVVALLALITIRWPASAGRVMVVVLVTSIIGFLASASIAAAGASIRPRLRQDEDDRHE